MICVRRVEVGALGANCYLVFREGEREGIVVDPGAEAERILGILREEGIRLRYIIDTHAHIDHTGASQEVSIATSAGILIHMADEPYLCDPFLNLKDILGEGGNPGTPARLLSGGDVIEVGGMEIHIIHTPGHTPGGICLSIKREEILFTGDTLFNGGIGRTDLPGGSYRDLMDSIKNSILSYSDDVVIYPGHGPSSTIGIERRSNPFLLS